MKIVTVIIEEVRPVPVMRRSSSSSTEGSRVTTELRVVVHAPNTSEALRKAMMHLGTEQTFSAEPQDVVRRESLPREESWPQEEDDE